MNHSLLCYWFGWAIGSRIPGVYIHLSGKDMDNVVDEMRGRTTTKKLEDGLISKNCQQCGKENAGTNDLCEQCGAALTIHGIIQKEDKLKQFEAEMQARQKVVEEYLKYQNERIKQLEAGVKMKEHAEA
jgi:methionyl-tRNA synthetase